MTVSKTHPISISGLETVLESGIFNEWLAKHPGSKLKLVFVLHPSVYEEFGKQSYAYSDVSSRDKSKLSFTQKPWNTQKVNDERKGEIEDYITQYAASVDLGQRLRELRGSTIKKRRLILADDEEDEEGTAK